METLDFERLLAELADLCHRQPGSATAEHDPAAQAQVTAAIRAAIVRPVCPHCGTTKCHRHGQAHGLPRYRCTGCRRTFNPLTATPLARLRHKDKWPPYLECLLDAMSVRTAAASVGVHRNTSLRWRHRFRAGAVTR